MSITISGSTGISGVDGSSTTPAFQGTDTNTGLFYGTDIVGISTGGSERVRVDSSGNVGIGTTSPVGKLDIGSGNLNFSSTAQRILGDFSNATIANRVIFQSSTTNGNSAITAMPNGTATTSSFQAFNTNDPANTSATQVLALSTESSFRNAINGTGTYLPMTFYTGGSERMRIDSDGNLLVGTTSNSSVSSKLHVSFSNFVVSINGTNATGESVRFYSNGSTAGTISYGASSVAYNTSSDYRLKENVEPMQNALNVVQQLKPVTYTWKRDGSAGQGFIAHELAELVPDCVTGEKDAVNEDGSIDPQGVDTSFLVATLTAAIQEQQTIINDLKARVTALEASNV